MHVSCSILLPQTLILYVRLLRWSSTSNPSKQVNVYQCASKLAISVKFFPAWLKDVADLSGGRMGSPHHSNQLKSVKMKTRKGIIVNLVQAFLHSAAPNFSLDIRVTWCWLWRLHRFSLLELVLTAQMTLRCCSGRRKHPSCRWLRSKQCKRWKWQGPWHVPMASRSMI